MEAPIPKRRKSLFVPIIIVINVGVYILWSFSDASESLLEIMMNNFLVSWDLLSQGRVWTLLTSAFSHNLLWHLFLNMYVLLSFGAFMEVVLGKQRFLKFYLSAAIISSLCHATLSHFLLDKSDLPALGASGAVSGVIVLFSLLFPRERILVLGIIPLPAMVGALLFIGLDIWGLAAQAGGGGLPIGHGAHLGGALTGIIYFFYLRNERRSLTPQ